MREIKLVSRLTLDAAQLLWIEIESALDESDLGVELNAAKVTYLSAAALQVMLATKYICVADRKELKITSPSEDFLHTLKVTGGYAHLQEYLA